MEESKKLFIKIQIPSPALIIKEKLIPQKIEPLEDKSIDDSLSSYSKSVKLDCSKNSLGNKKTDRLAPIDRCERKNELNNFTVLQGFRVHKSQFRPNKKPFSLTYLKKKMKSLTPINKNLNNTQRRLNANCSFLAMTPIPRNTFQNTLSPKYFSK